MHPVDWRYYDWGPRDYPEPIICLHSVLGSAECFYHQIISIAPRGYRIISIQIPTYWTVSEFCDALHNFLDTIPHRRVHLYGAGLGGFLAMQYAVRKPERVGSIILTHSFLATEGLKFGIPYSPAMLRWLPDFVIRSTYRAIMPKGRVALDLANAAELAIGHTMLSSREELASRLALSMTDSSVVNRLHIPQSAITIIDTLDRTPAALELTNRTTGYLPNARRAFLKCGGEFPYISVPDEVNVHLIVHLRRQAPPPAIDIQVPAPAKPRVLPLSARRRRELEEAQLRAREAQAKEENAKIAQKQTQRSRSSPEELLDAAKVLVEAERQQSIEKSAFEIARLKEFLPGRDDAYLSAVLDDCDGNLDSAISNALGDQYGDLFYENVFDSAIEKALSELQRSEIEALAEESSQQTDEVTEGGKEAEAAVRAVGIGGGSLGSGGSPGFIGDGAINTAPGCRNHGVLSRDPLGETAPSDMSPQQTGVDGTPDVKADQEKSTAEKQSGMDASPKMKMSRTGSENAGMPDDPLAGPSTTTSSGSVMSSIDLGTKAFHGTTGKRQSTAESDSQSEGRHESDAKQEGDVRNRGSRRPRRRSFPQTVDSVDEYVSSEKVGMRSEGQFIGRGPAPFNNASVGTGLSPGEAWMRTARPVVEEPPEDVENPSDILASGESLLEAGENPLQLPRHDSAYSGGRHMRDGSGSHSRGSTPTYLTRQSADPPPDSGFLASEPEVVVHSESSTTGDSMAKQQDEWEKFRRRESDKGLAEVFYTPPRPGSVERRLDKAFILSGTEVESEEAARLREWAMSAQAASKNVHR